MTKAQQEEALTRLLGEKWTQVSRKLTQLAEAFPPDAFESHPVAAIRTPGEVLRHVAFWNQYVADALRGRENDGATNELPPAAYPTKASVLEVLAHTSEDVIAALRQCAAPLDLKVVELLGSFMEHTSEHYGQLVVYARLMGIVPPASQA